MRTATDAFTILAALKEIHREVTALRKDVDELRDEMKVTEHGGIHIHVELGGATESESESARVSHGGESDD